MKLFADRASNPMVTVPLSATRPVFGHIMASAALPPGFPAVEIEGMLCGFKSDLMPPSEAAQVCPSKNNAGVPLSELLKNDVEHWN